MKTFGIDGSSHVPRSVDLVFYEAADAGLLSPDLAAGIRRVEGAKKLGVRIGNWLTAEQGKRLLDVFDHQTLRGLPTV